MAELKALLDTNIIIHRENNRLTNDSIGVLYNWLDKLHYSKCIHECSIDEIHKYKDKEYKKLLDVKMESYERLEKFDEPNEKFLDKLSIRFPIKNENDEVDNQLLYEVYQGRVSLLITEDNKVIDKAISLGIVNKVVSIDDFIAGCKEKFPELKEYKFNSVFLTKFGNIDLKDQFFDSLRESYKGFDDWYNGKKDEPVYVHYNSLNELSGFLYIKIEYENEDYNNIVPKFEPKKRLKIGTFKVVSTGYRVGERFLQIVFDNAIRNDVDEIYVTMFDNSDDLKRLKKFLMGWGFEEFGIKNGKEKVLIKKLNEYHVNKTIKENFPNIDYNARKVFLPIRPEYHTKLFPDSILNTERKIEFEDYLAHRYALEKIYIAFSLRYDFRKGDIALVYRTKDYNRYAKYSSTLTSICIIEDVIKETDQIDIFLEQCNNRSIFSNKKLVQFWNTYHNKMQIIKLIYIMPLKNKIILNRLRELNIIPRFSGAISATIVSDDNFRLIMKESNTKLYGYKI